MLLVQKAARGRQLFLPAAEKGRDENFALFPVVRLPTFRNDGKPNEQKSLNPK
jgi:hypothetical protein